MIECLIKAERECTDNIDGTARCVDVSPDKVLHLIGATFKEWIECLYSTDLPHWVTWKVVGYVKTYRGRRGNTLLYERMEEIELA